MYLNIKNYENIYNCLRVIQQIKIRKSKSANCWQQTSLNENWFTFRVITKEFVTIGNGMRTTGKILTYLIGLSYLDTRNNQLIVIKTVQNLY